MLIGVVVDDLGFIKFQTKTGPADEFLLFSFAGAGAAGRGGLLF